MAALDIDEEVFKLKQKLSQCELERERIRTEKERWMNKEKLLRRETEQVEEEVRVATESGMSARAEFENKKKLLTESLAAKKETVRQLDEALNELDANDENYLKERSAIADDKVNRMWTIPLLERDKLDKLHLEINEKRDELIAFLKAYVNNSKIIDDVKPLLRVHYDAYIDTLKGDVDDGCEMLRKYVRSVIGPGFAQKVNEMFARVDLICPCPAAMFRILNVFVTKKT